MKKSSLQHEHCILSEKCLRELTKLIYSSNVDVKSTIIELYILNRKRKKNDVLSLGEQMEKILNLKLLNTELSITHHKEYLKKIKKIKKNAKEMFQIFEYNADFTIENFDGLFIRNSEYKYISDDGADIFEGKMNTSPEQICSIAAQVIVASDILINKQKSVMNSQGRPPLSAFYEFIYNNAVLYEKLAEEKFTILRHKIDNEYVPITDGHRFVNLIIDDLNMSILENKYTSQNLMNACEKAVKKLRE